MYDEEIIKSVRKVTLITGAVFAAIGILMLIFQASVEEAIGYAVGAVFAALGVIRLIQYAFVQRKQSLMATWLYEGALLAFFGIFCLIHHGEVFGYASVIFCVMLLAGCIIKMQNAIDLKRIGAMRGFWLTILILSLVSLLLAVLLAWDPAFVAKAYVKSIGMFMIFDGFSALFTVVWVQFCLHALKKRVSGGEKEDQGEDPETSPDPMADMSREAEESAEDALAAKKNTDEAAGTGEIRPASDPAGADVSTLEAGTARAFENKEDLFDAKGGEDH